MDIKVEVQVYNPGCNVTVAVKDLPESMTGYLREDGAVVPEVQLDGVFFQVMESIVKDVVEIINNRELNKKSSVDIVKEGFEASLD